MGLVGEAVPVLDYADYSRKYGGLSTDSAISYQAYAFFNNGGEQGVVLRLYAEPLSTKIVLRTPIKKGAEYALAVQVNNGPASPPVSVTASEADEADLAQKLATALTTQLGSEKALSASEFELTPKGNTIEVAFTPAEGEVTATKFLPIRNIGIEGPEILGKGLAQVQTGNSTAIALPSGTTEATKDKVYTVTVTPAGGAAIDCPVTATDQDTEADKFYAALAAAINAKASQYVSAAVAADKKSVELSYVKNYAQITTSLDLSATTSTNGPTFQAASEGLWGDGLRVSIDVLSDGNCNLNVTYMDGTSTQTEQFLNVTFADDPSTNPQRVDKVLEQGSSLLRWTYDASVANALTDNSVWVGAGIGGADSAPLEQSDYLDGIGALDALPYGFNIVCVPPDDIDQQDGGSMDMTGVYAPLSEICVKNNAMLLIDPPTSWYTAWSGGNTTQIDISQIGTLSAEAGRNAAVYFPRVVIADPLHNGQPKVLPPCGFIAAAWASTDTASGVWKAPAGLDVPLGGIIGLQAKLSDEQNGVLNPQGINALRDFGDLGKVSWGARTVRGADVLGDEYKYVPVRRLALYIATSMLEDTKWAVFQPNGEALWAKLKDQVGTFMAGLFSQGAFAGSSQDKAFFVNCDKSTTTPSDQAAGIVNVQIGFAPLYPAEFVVITVSQMAAKSG